MESVRSRSPTEHPGRNTNGQRTYSYSCNPRTDQLVSVQSRYIDNLQQQIFYLESEVTYLRNQINESGKCRPRMILEMENMVDRLLEAEKVGRRLEEEIQRRDFTISNLNQGIDRLKREVENSEETRRNEKMTCVQELVQMRQQNSQMENRLAESEKRVEVYKEGEEIANKQIHLKETAITKLTQQLQMSENMVQELKQKLQEQQTMMYKEKITAAKEEAPIDQTSLINSLRKDIQEISGRLRQTEEKLENEKIIREKLANDNHNWIKIETELTSQVAELKTRITQEETRRKRTEKHYSDLVNEIAEAQAITTQQKALLEELNKSIESDKQGRGDIEDKLREEQYKKTKLERSMEELKQKLDEQMKKTTRCLEQNCSLQRDNILLNENVTTLEEKVNKKETEIEKMKQRIFEMKKSVDAILKQNEATLEIQDCRWRHMSELAEGIQQLSRDATSVRS